MLDKLGPAQPQFVFSLCLIHWKIFGEKMPVFSFPSKRRKGKYSEQGNFPGMKSHLQLKEKFWIELN